MLISPIYSFCSREFLVAYLISILLSLYFGGSLCLTKKNCCSNLSKSSGGVPRKAPERGWLRCLVSFVPSFLLESFCLEHGHDSWSSSSHFVNKRMGPHFGAGRTESWKEPGYLMKSWTTLSSWQIVVYGLLELTNSTLGPAQRTSIPAPLSWSVYKLRISSLGLTYMILTSSFSSCWVSFSDCLFHSGLTWVSIPCLYCSPPLLLGMSSPDWDDPIQLPALGAKTTTTNPVIQSAKAGPFV